MDDSGAKTIRDTASSGGWATSNCVAMVLSQLCFCGYASEYIHGAIFGKALYCKGEKVKSGRCWDEVLSLLELHQPLQLFSPKHLQLRIRPLPPSRGNSYGLQTNVICCFSLSSLADIQNNFPGCRQTLQVQPVECRSACLLQNAVCSTCLGQPWRGQEHVLRWQ